MELATPADYGGHEGKNWAWVIGGSVVAGGFVWNFGYLGENMYAEVTGRRGKNGDKSGTTPVRWRSLEP